MARVALKEIKKQIAKLRMQRALHHAVPLAAGINFQPGQQVLVWREKVISNLIGEWKVPFAVESTDERKKTFHVKNLETGPA